MRSLNNLASLRKFVTGLRRRWLERSTGAVIDVSVSISLSAKLVGGQGGAIRIGEKTLIAFKTLLLARRPDGSIEPITIGRHCFIGGGTFIAPGLSIGDGCVIAAGSVVLDDIPSRSVAGGNPARVLRSNVEVLPYGRFPEASQNQSAYSEHVKSTTLPRKGLVALGALIGLGLMAKFFDELPRWRPGGALPAPMVSLRDAGTFPLRIGAQTNLTFVGDSNTAGSRVGGSKNAFPSLLHSRLNTKGKVENLAAGGATVLTAVRPGKPVSGLVFVMLGTNDSAVRGAIGARQPVPLATYRDSLSRIVADLTAGPATVVVLAPPPVGSVAMARRLAPYRLESRKVAVEQGVSFVDAAAAFVDGGTGSPLSYDALHLNADGQRLLADYLATRIVVS